MCQLFEQVVALVDQASNRTNYYRRSYTLESVINDQKRAKDILAENEKSFEDADALFGEAFEEKVQAEIERCIYCIIREGALSIKLLAKRIRE